MLFGLYSWNSLGVSEFGFQACLLAIYLDRFFNYCTAVIASSSLILVRFMIFMIRRTVSCNRSKGTNFLFHFAFVIMLCCM